MTNASRASRYNPRYRTVAQVTQARHAINVLVAYDKENTIFRAIYDCRIQQGRRADAACCMFASRLSVARGRRLIRERKKISVERKEAIYSAGNKSRRHLSCRSICRRAAKPAI